MEEAEDFGESVLSSAVEEGAATVRVSSCDADDVRSTGVSDDEESPPVDSDAETGGTDVVMGAF